MIESLFTEFTREETVVFGMTFLGHIQVDVPLARALTSPDGIEPGWLLAHASLHAIVDVFLLSAVVGWSVAVTTGIALGVIHGVIDLSTDDLQSDVNTHMMVTLVVAAGLFI